MALRLSTTNGPPNPDERSGLMDGGDVSPGDEPFQVALLSEGAVAALRQGDLASAQVFAEQMTAIAENSAFPQARVQAVAILGDIAEAQGKRDQAHDLLNKALVLARVARLTDSEAGLLVQLGHWNAHGGRFDAARACATDALHLARHAQLRLRQVDAFNLLSGIEYACGNQHEASSAAAEAYRLAWCDGPPFTYEWGLRQARKSLMATGEPEPTNLPTFNAASQIPELGIVPTSLLGALALQPPLDHKTLKEIIARLPKGDNSIAALRKLYESTAFSAEIRAAALDALMIQEED